MTINPSPPTELVDLVGAYRLALRSFLDVGHGVSADGYLEQTCCPGWTVHDQISHIASLEDYFDGGEYPEVELPNTEHVNSDFARFVEYGVQARRATPTSEVLAELETLLHNRISTLTNPDLTLESMVRGPGGREITLGDLLGRRLVDLFVHEQDIREAIGRIGNLDSPAAAHFMHRIVDAFPIVVPKRLDLPAGVSVIVESTGPVTGRVGVRMAHDEDENVVAHPLFTGDGVTAATDLADQGTHPDQEVRTVTISMSTDALTRRAAGRRSTADTAYRVVGDEDIAERVLSALTIIR